MCIWNISLSQLIINKKEKNWKYFMELLKIRNSKKWKEIKMKKLNIIIK